MGKVRSNNVEEKIAGLGLELPEPSTPGGSYVSVNVRGNIAYVAIQFPISNETFRYQGKLGGDLTTQQGYEAMRLCALNVLSQINAKVGFEKIQGLNHIDAYFQAADNWDDAPVVVDGASELFVEALDEAGRHSRAIFGVERLPKNFSVGLTASFTLNY